MRKKKDERKMERSIQIMKMYKKKTKINKWKEIYQKDKWQYTENSLKGKKREECKVKKEKETENKWKRKKRLED